MSRPGARLGAALKQAKPFASESQAVAIAITRLAGRFRDEFAELLRPHGLSLAQFNILRILRGAGEPGLPCGEIAERLVTRDPDMTRLLDRLEKQGLVARARDTDDRRVVLTRITRKGLDAIAPLDEPVLALHHRQVGHLGPERLRQLLELLEDAGAAQAVTPER